MRQRWTADNIEHVWVEESEGKPVPSTLTHEYAVVDGRKKLSALRTLLLRNSVDSGGVTVLPRSIVFIMSTRPVRGIVDALNDTFPLLGDKSIPPVVGLADDMSVLERARAMRRFRRGDVRVLISTDLAARGLDVDAISHVFHFDLATDADAYLHRAGRSGRQGNKGTSVSLVTPGEEFVIRRTANALGIVFNSVQKKKAPLDSVK